MSIPYVHMLLIRQMLQTCLGWLDEAITRHEAASGIKS